MADMISLSIVHGDDASFPVTVAAEGSPSVVDLTGATITADIRKEYSSAVVGSFTITETDLSIGSFSLDLSSATTTALPQNTKGRIQSFVFDVQIVYADTTRDTIISGYLKVANEVTV